MSHTKDYCSICGIRGDSVCGVLDFTRELPELSQHIHTKTYAAGDVIITDSAPLFFMGIILSGMVKLVKPTNDGQNCMVALLFPSDFLGRPDSKTMPYYAIACEEVRICYADVKEYNKIFDKFPHLQKKYLQITTANLDLSHEWQVLLARETAREKVISFIQLFYKKRHCKPNIYIALSRMEIADFLGLSPETVSRQLSILKQENHIAINGHHEITILNPDFFINLP